MMVAVTARAGMVTTRAVISCHVIIYADVNAGLSTPADRRNCQRVKELMRAASGNPASESL